MMFILEVSPPFRLRPKVERIGVMYRLIWLWFSVAYVSNNFAGFVRVTKNMITEQLKTATTSGQLPIDTITVVEFIENEVLPVRNSHDQ